jgi:hypothetical protein
MSASGPTVRFERLAHQVNPNDRAVQARHAAHLHLDRLHRREAGSLVVAQVEDWTHLRFKQGAKRAGQTLAGPQLGQCLFVLGQLTSSVVTRCQEGAVFLLCGPIRP